MRLSSLALASILTVAFASQIEPVPTHQLEARDPTFGLVSGLIGGLLGGGHHSSLRIPSREWRCNGRGNDGYQYDCYGNSRPRNIPQGWAYFGLEVGWAPTSSWSCSSHYKFSAEFLSRAHLVTWWTPSLAWKQHNAGVNLGVTIDHWGLLPGRPSRDWKCDGSGRDGLTIDWQGNGRPSWCPSGWLWFGETIGWGPPRGFDLSIGIDLPSVWLPKAHLCTWWKPTTAWLGHHAGGLDISIIPGFWGIKPSASWKCDGSGKDGWVVDHKGNGPPSWVPSGGGWYWFGTAIGWQPGNKWSCGSSWTIPTEWQSSCGKATWWTPPDHWVSKHHGHKWSWNFYPPQHWGCEVPSTIPSLPSTTSRPPHSSSAKVTKTTARPITTTVVSKPSKPCTTSSKAVTTSVRPPSTSSKPEAVPCSKAKTTTSARHTTTSIRHTTTSTRHTTTAKPKPSSTAGGGSDGGSSSTAKGGSHGGSITTITVTKTKTKVVTVPTNSNGHSCVCEDGEEQHRLARRHKSRLHSR